MAKRDLRGTLELTWMGKDQALIPTSENTYDYEWVERGDPRACQTRYLVKDRHVGDTADGGIHDNLLVTGDSGDVLEALTRVPQLAEKYVGRVKCAYIDPPFNTSKTFTHYEDNLEHSIWLTFMRDRLVLIKRLLSEDGSVWVHLDNSENHRMRSLLDEVFGLKNFVAEIAWQKTDSSRNDSPVPSADHDVILVYRKSSSWTMNRMDRSADLNARFTAPDGDAEVWWDDNPTAPSGERNQLWIYAIQHPITGSLLYPASGRCWFAEPGKIFAAMSEYAQYEFRDIDDAKKRAELAGIAVEDVRERVHALMLKQPLEISAKSARARYALGDWPEIILRGGGEGGIGRKARIPSTGRVPSTWWTNREVGHNRQAKAEIKALFPGQGAFGTPKPERLLKRILHIATNPGDIVLDCFAGSGTTAAVAHKMGRRWVTVELLPGTVDSFTRPRLQKVVEGEAGGVSVETEYIAAGSLPGATTTDEARIFTTVLGRVLTELETGDIGDLEDPRSSNLDLATTDEVHRVAKRLKAVTRTRKVTVRKWQGGGGFEMAHLSPAWVDVEVDSASGEASTFISPAATGEVLSRSIAAHLAFHLTPQDTRFVGIKGRQRLAIVEGLLTEAKAQELADALPSGASVTVVCDGAPEGVSRLLQKRAKGSRVLVMPDDLFSINRSKEIL